MGRRMGKVGRRSVVVAIGVVAAASLLTSCYDREYGSGELRDVNDAGLAALRRRP